MRTRSPRFMIVGVYKKTISLKTITYLREHTIRNVLAPGQSRRALSTTDRVFILRSPAPQPTTPSAAMAFMKRTIFPQELIDIVIDNLQTDNITLAQTSLVASSWLHRSRKHKFRQLVVRSSDMERRFVQLSLALSGTSAMGKHVQHLVLQGRQYEACGTHSPSLLAELPPDLLASILQQLPELKTLQLHDVSFRGGAPPPRDFKPINLDEVIIMNCGSSRDTTSDVLNVLSMFSEVKFLHMSAIAQDVDPEDDSDDSSDEDEVFDDVEADGSARGDEEEIEVNELSQAEGSPISSSTYIPWHSKVSSLKLEDVASDVYLEALTDSKSVKMLRSVEVECTAVEDAVALSALLDKAGPHVEHLAIDLSQYLQIDYALGEDSEDIEIPDSEAMIEAIEPGLSSCEKLESFDIAVSFCQPMEDGTTYHNLAWDCLLSTLRATPSTVSAITIELSADGWLCSLENIGVDWAPMQDLWKRFDNLKSVSFVTAPGCDWQFSDKDRKFLEAKFERVCDEGVFQIVD